jgi:trk system potassium uptake protein TrkA
MRVLIVGAGVVGSNLAQQFSSEGHDVAVVDRNPELIRKLTEKLDVMALTGDGASLEVLKEAGVERSEMVVAVTESDPVNLVICATAGRFPVKQKIARVRSEEIATDPEDFYRKTFSVDQMINPETFIAESLSEMVRIPSCIDVAHFEKGNVMLCGFAADGDVPLTETTIQECRAQHIEVPYLIVAVSRRGDLFIPRGADHIEAGDKVYVILPRDEVERFAPLVSTAGVQKEHRIVLVAGSPESQRLAAALEAHGHQISVIERDEHRAISEAENLSRGIVYHGEATDLDLLREAGTERADFFIAAGPDEESNLFSALLAKRQGARRTVVFTNEAAHLPVLHSIGIDVVINPRLATAGAILHLVRRGDILQAAKLGHSDAEALQYEVPAGAPVVGKPLMELDIPRMAILGAVVRGEEVRIPDGHTVLEPGDRVVVFTLPEAVGAVERLFAAA